MNIKTRKVIVENILHNLSEEDILDIIEDGQLEEFCNTLTLDLHVIENTASKYTA